MNDYTFPFPQGATVDELLTAAVPGTVPAPSRKPYIVQNPNNTFSVVWSYAVALTPAQQSALGALIATNPHPSNTPFLQRDAAAARLQNLVTPLRNQAAQLAALTPNGVTAGNVVAVVQGIVNNLAVDLDRLADLIVALGAGS